MKETNLLKFVCVLLCLFICQLKATSQKNFQDGYIVNLNSDTIRGKIDYRNWDMTPRRIEFMRNAASEPAFYSPSDIQFFSVAEENYTSAIITIDKSPHKLKELDVSGEFRLGKDTVFLEVLASGKKSFFYLKSYDDKVNFFIKGDSGIQSLNYKEYKEIADGVTLLRKNELYKNDLLFYLRDCAEIEPAIRKMSYTLSDMQALISEYFACKGTRAAYQKKEEKIKSDFGILAGVSLAKLKFSSTNQSGYKLAHTDFPQSFAFAAGIFYNIYLSRNLNKLSLNNELLYSSYKADGMYEEQPSNITTVRTTTTLNYSYLKLNTLFRYTFPVGSAFLFVNGGVSNGVAISETNRQKEVTIYNNTEAIKERPALSETKKYELGFIGGMGTRYNNYSVEARFESGNGMTGSANLRCTVNRFFLLFGYRF